MNKLNQSVKIDYCEKCEKDTEMYKEVANNIIDETVLAYDYPNTTSITLTCKVCGTVRWE